MEYDFLDIGTDENTLESNEQDLLLMNLTDELLIENIEEQIKSLNSIFYENTNYIDVFENRYKYLLERFRDTQDFINDLTESRQQFFLNIFNKIKEKFNLQIDTFEIEDNLYIMTRVLYEFLILDYMTNIKNFVLQYINVNRKSLLTTYENKIKNLDSVSLKKVLKNKNDAIIIANLYNIIDDLSNIEFTTENILSYIVSCDESEYNNYFMNKYFIEDKDLASSDFSSKFLAVLKKGNKSYNRIVNEIQLELLQNSNLK